MPEIVETLVFRPAELVAFVLSGVLYLGYFIGSLAIAIYAGKLVYDHLRIPVLRALLAVIVGVWISLILYAAQVPTAVKFIKAVEMSELD
ncbi:hypothetical protein [Martelella mediterranea]|uniref:hypothetical protein n=1 Tax=Martelella mediterranea TaxID=293089 RepID=UPI00105123F8|nr:hypothetical protein [Martelella mediterranea]